MPATWRSRWRPWRNLLRRRLGLGRFGRRGLQRRLDRTREDLASALRRLHRGVAADGDVAPDFCSHESRLYSQNGEDGLLLHLLSTVGVTDRRLVEFGIEDGRECLARSLVQHFGWGGLLMDSSGRSVREAERFYRRLGVGPDRLQIRRCLVTAENIDDVLVDAGLAGDFDLLAIDIDGSDYWVWKAVRAAQPRVVVVEYNASFGPDEDAVVRYDPGFDRKAAHPSGWYHGASLRALARLGRAKGYALVGCDSAGINAFFVRRELLGTGLAEADPGEAWRPHRSRSRRAGTDQQLALLRTLELVRDDEPDS